MRLQGAPHFLVRWAFCVLVALLLCGPCGQCCGPGRGGGRRRSPRKLTPLVFKQHVPNVAENTLGASGITDGRITRHDERFYDLVPNYNADIYFKDEEGTGEDRVMSERCNERLNTLSISVMNQWPGVRLYVFEAWDNGSSHHEPQSLHYEGRAVDIATTDRDRSKLGMLARLAVEAGFDWVFYESRSHIHCSVKSESKSMKRLAGCFPKQASVETSTGQKSMSDLKPGDLVKVFTREGQVKFSPVLMFLHEDPLTTSRFLTLVTNEASLTLTSSHLVFLLRNETASGKPDLETALAHGHAALAGSVRAGDFLIFVKASGAISLTKVVDIKTTLKEGVYAPLTKEGTIIVNDIVASCYAVIDSQALAHWAFLPVRMYFQIKDTLLSFFYALGVITPDKGETNINPIQNVLIPSTVLAKKTAVNDINSIHRDVDSDQNITKIRWKNRENKSVRIHWYANLLYRMASRMLPNHLVYS